MRFETHRETAWRAALAAAVLAGGTVIGLGPLTEVSAAPLRATTTAVSCTGHITAGSATTCTVTVKDAGSGHKSAPLGSATVASSPADAVAFGSPCSLRGRTSPSAPTPPMS